MVFWALCVDNAVAEKAGRDPGAVAGHVLYHTSSAMFQPTVLAPQKAGLRP